MTIESNIVLTDDQKKAMALIKQGKRHTLLYGGSRCVSGDTIIDGYKETIEELAIIGKPIIVKTTHGLKIAKAPFLKGADYLYEFQTESGKKIKVTNDHLFHDGNKWRKAETFKTGDSLAVQLYSPSLPASSWALSLSVWFLSVLHLIQKPQDWPGYCCKYRRQYDGQLRFLLRIAQVCRAFAFDVMARIRRNRFEYSPVSSNHTFHHVQHVEEYNRFGQACRRLFQGEILHTIWLRVTSGVLRICARFQHKRQENRQYPVGLHRPISGAQYQDKEISGSPGFHGEQPASGLFSFSKAKHKQHSTRSPKKFLHLFYPLNKAPRPYPNQKSFSLDTPNNNGYKLEKIVFIQKTSTPERYYTTVVNVSQQYFANGFLNHNSGKTFLIVLCIVIRALMYPGSRHLIYRLRLKDVDASIWMETLPKVISSFEGLNKYIKTNEQKHIMFFPNGSELWCYGVDDTRNYDSVLGKEYTTIYANEASQIPFMTIWKVRTRLAQKTPGCINREFVDLNPPTISHWTAKEFIKKIDPTRSKPGNLVPLHDPEKYVWMQMNPEGNKQNLDPEYMDTLKYAPDSMRKRFYEGNYAQDDALMVFPVPDTGYYAGKDFENWVKEVGAGNVRFAAGLDLGFEDADGFVIVAYCPRWESGQPKARDEIEAARRGRVVEAQIPENVRKRWLIYEYKARRTGLSDLAKAVTVGLKWAENTANSLGLSSANILIYSDTGGGGAKMVYDLRTEHKLPVCPAYKRDKLAAIEMLQDDVKASRFMIPADGAFAQECEAIVWTKDPETGEVIRTIDDKQYHPDIMDAVLYAMRAVWVQSLGQK